MEPSLSLKGRVQLDSILFIRTSFVRARYGHARGNIGFRPHHIWNWSLPPCDLTIQLHQIRGRGTNCHFQKSEFDKQIFLCLPKNGLHRTIAPTLPRTFYLTGSDFDWVIGMGITRGEGFRFHLPPIPSLGMWHVNKPGWEAGNSEVAMGSELAAVR